jgi:Fe-S cluster assembly protein SufD
MIAEKSNTAQNMMDRISASAGKVGYMSDELLGKALVTLENKGFPNNKVEDYKYCNMDALLKKEFRNIEQKFITTADIKPFKLDEAVTLVVLNGQFSAALSDKVILTGLHINDLSNLDAKGKQSIGSLANVESDAFVALNTSFCRGGFHLRINKGEELRMPLHIIYINAAETEAIVNTRNIIELEEGASATIVEHYVGAVSGKIFSNYLSEKIVAPSAKLSCYTIQEEGTNGFSLTTNQVSVDKDAVYDNTTITLSGALVRNNHNVVIKGQYAAAHLYGLFLAKNTQLVDNHTLMDHQVPNCESNELYKGIINDKAVGTFNGKIFVRKDAQKTNAYQSSKNILLSDDGTINTKPQLEIYADDVKCSHGTSTGRIDESALFYLNARGIGKESGRRLLLASFAGEVLQRIELESLKERLETAFENEI